MRSAWVQVPRKTVSKSRKTDDKFCLSCDGLFRKARRIDVDFVHVSNEEEVSVLRQCSLEVDMSLGYGDDGVA